ncbi:WD40 repeat protein [Ceratocystis pirilliformis]|uniref:WD40 repeat protein n=1 Tax=Ceratocystis pirilliformis TaxID=259994 RepID=A0ABR3ZNJ9_9PEZI
MYWPVGCARAYTTSNNQAQPSTIVLSDDDAQSPYFNQGNSSIRSQYRSDDNLPTTPLTPSTPYVESMDGVDDADTGLYGNTNSPSSQATTTVALNEPIRALRVSRTGHIFATVTARTITVWQTKPTVILGVVARSETSIESYGENDDLLIRPDSAIFVVRTRNGYLITYSMAADPQARVYKAHWPNHTNVQRRRQSNAGGLGANHPDQFLWGAGEGFGIEDVSLRFRMVIKIDAGIESALALEDELVVATRKPAAVQCILWAPDSTGKQTRTELVSKMPWAEKKSTICEMTYDRPMNLSTWVMADGRAYAVQKIPPPTSTEGMDPAELKRLFRGHCFHIPQNPGERAVKAVVNARFSLIAVGCADGMVKVYSVKDYSGNIPLSHTHLPPVSPTTSGLMTCLRYSPDGYCLFAGFRKGWTMWSVYGKRSTHSFNNNSQLSHSNGDGWLEGVDDAAWIGGGAEILLINRKSAIIWSLEMARSTISGCYMSASIFRTVLQMSNSLSVYQGYDLPDLALISSEPYLWHTTKIPAVYLLQQWPIKSTAISPDGRYVAVAGRRGLAHYSVSSGRWKTFANPTEESEFTVRGGMCWYQNVLVAAVESDQSQELRLYPRDSALASSNVLFTMAIHSPVVLVTLSDDDSLLVYTYDNILYHFLIVPSSGKVSLVQVGQIAFHGIVRSPARVRGLGWILPESQLSDGDPSQDVSVATVIFLVDGKLVALKPTVGSEGQHKYNMRVLAQNVEFHCSMREEPFAGFSREFASVSAGNNALLRRSLWVYDGNHMNMWPDLYEVLEAVTGDETKGIPDPVALPMDFYPLSVVVGKALVLGVESELIQRRDIGFSTFRSTIRTHLFLPDTLRHYLTQGRALEALQLSRQYEKLTYFSHALEVLLHQVLDDEVDSSPKPEEAILPRVLSLCSSFKDYLDIVLQCTRKTEVRQWRTLFDYLPPVQELFEESLQRGSVKTAGGYLIILHTLDELESVLEQSVRVLSRAMHERDWELCKELARFLAALDESGSTLREAMELVNAPVASNNFQGDDTSILGRLELLVPAPRTISSFSNSNGDKSAESSLGSLHETPSLNSMTEQTDVAQKG